MGLRDKKDVIVTQNTISTILMGGLGNVMFQIATLLSYCHDKGYRPIVGYWTNHQSESSKWSGILNRNGRNHHFDPWGGHVVKDKDISIGDIFPKLPWFENRPNAFQWWFDQQLAWDFDTGKGGEFIDLDTIVKNTPSIFQGYFFNHQYWHHNRELVLSYFTPDENITKWIEYNYGELYHKDTISVHLRLGNDNDFIQPVRVEPEWVTNIIKEIDDNSNVLIFSDNLQLAKKYIEYTQLPKSKFYIIDEDPYICMLMMAKCNKHILSNSTLSFWGAYLDNKEDNEYTYIHESFFEHHPRTMIPYKSWKIKS